MKERNHAAHSWRNATRVRISQDSLSEQNAARKKILFVTAGTLAPSVVLRWRKLKVRCRVKNCLLLLGLACARRPALAGTRRRVLLQGLLRLRSRDFRLRALVVCSRSRQEKRRKAPGLTALTPGGALDT